MACPRQKRLLFPRPSSSTCSATPALIKPAAAGAAARDHLAAPSASADQIHAVLLRHAAAASALARSVEDLEAQLLNFMAAPENTNWLPKTLHLAERVDHLRAGLMDEIARACRLAQEADAPRGPQRATIVIAAPAPLSEVPTRRRLRQAK